LEDGGDRRFDARPDARAFDNTAACCSRNKAVANTIIGCIRNVEPLIVRCGIFSWIQMTRTEREYKRLDLTTTIGAMIE
jgi:hypothetical protein